MGWFGGSEEATTKNKYDDDMGMYTKLWLVRQAFSRTIFWEKLALVLQ